MRIPLARYGTKEIAVIGGGCALVIAALLFAGPPAAWFVPLPALLLVAVLWFFRDPTRRIPEEAGAVVAPADGKVVAIREMEEEEFVGGPATRIDIFLAVYDVHVNRAPVSGEIRHLSDRDGPFLNALNLDAGDRNRAKSIGILAADGGFPVLVRQIVGAVARRIVCGVEIGQIARRGDRIGMIKFGSRTQLALPASVDFDVRVKVGDRVRGGSTILGVVGNGGGT